LVFTNNTTRADHQHAMCGMTTHQLKIVKESRFGYYKEDCKVLYKELI